MIVQLFVICLGPICIPMWGLFPVLLVFWNKIMAFFFGKKEAVAVEVKGKDGQRITSGVVTIKSAKNFASIIESSEIPVLVDFTATWCGPCQRIKPFFLELSSRYHAEFLQVDVDEFEKIAGDAGISSMPTFQLYFQGEKIGEFSGANEEKLEALLSSNSAKNK
eukprot:Stramenopile-MAST_4_protein_1059